MGKIRRVVLLGLLLLVVAWGVYFRTVAGWYRGQEDQLDTALTVGQRELAQLENHMGVLGQLEQEVTQLELLAEGLRRQLPPSEDQMVLWERLVAFCQGYEIENVSITYLGEESVPGAQENLGVSSFCITYESDYETSLKLVQGLRERRQFHSIERLAISEPSQGGKTTQLSTTIQIGVYYDKSQVTVSAESNLLELMGATDAMSRPRKEETEEEGWRMSSVGEAAGKVTYKIEGLDRENIPYRVEVVSQQPPTVREDVQASGYYLVVETVEGEKVKQWLGE